jgi:NADPH-dependent 2,4-dienoyl-CoA reductase/sulfur reductase-like enzyme/rhodanese-related sulfurtransferase
MKIIIIGAVAAGTSAAAKARRNDETARITVYEKDDDISYSACGLPYYIGGEVASIDELVPRNAEFFKSKYNVDIFTGHEVLKVNKTNKELTVKNLSDGTVFIDNYDVLVLATGAVPISPPIPGITNKNVFVLRNPSSAEAIKDFMNENKPHKATIVGSGFIGLEMAENLFRAGMDVTIVEKLPYVCPSLDEDMANHVDEYLKAKGLKVLTGQSVIEISEGKTTLDNGVTLETEMIIMSVGARPNIELAKQMGVETGPTGAIRINRKMQTNVPGVYACGDCTESYSIIDGQPIYRPLGSTANKMGRIAGDVITGGNLEFHGVAGTRIFRVFDMTVASTGYTEAEARQKGYDIAICHNIKPDKPEYYHGKEMVIKAIADKNSEKLLGVQIVGFSGVDKRIDVFVTAMTFGAKASDLFHLDLAYAPPFSTTKDPVIYTGMILDNMINRGREMITPNELMEQDPDFATIIDTRVEKQYQAGHVEGAISLPHEKIRQSLDDIDREKPVVVYCNKGTTGNAVQNILINNGFKKVYNVSGGYKQYKTYTGNK